MNRNKKILLGILILVLGSLIVMGIIFFRKPSYKQIVNLAPNMTVEEVVHKLGKTYRDVGSGTKGLSYMLRDRPAAAVLTFYEDKLINAVIQYRTGEVEFIIRPDYMKGH